MKSKKTLALLLSLVFLATSIACATPAQPAQPEAAPAQNEAAGPAQAAPAPDAPAATAVKRDVLVMAINSEPGTLNPYDHDLTNAFLLTSLVFETLIEKDADGNFQPKLATEWNWIDDTTVQFKLREGVVFHDGTPLTAEDVAYSMGIMATSTFTSNLFGCIDLDNTKIDDDYTITVKLKEPYAPFENALSSYRGAIISKDAYEAMGKDAFGRAPVGTGPMKFDAWVTGDHYEFSKFDQYWGEDTLNYDNILARIIIESSSRTMELETGGVDIAFDLPISDWDRIDANPDTNLIYGDGLRFEYYMYNIEKEINKDIRVRQAMAHAVDTTALVNTVWMGHASVADSFMPPKVPGYKPVGPYKYDPELAKQLLSEAGYPDGFEFDFITWENGYNGQVAEVLQSMWAAVGIKANIQVVDLPSFVAQFNAGELQVTHTGTTSGIADPAASLMIWPITRTISLRHHDQKIQDFLDKGVTIYDPAARAAHYGEMMDYCFEQCYVVPLAYLQFGYGTRKDVLNMTFSADNIPDLSVIAFAK